jgi:hypothetical protein
MDSEMDNANGQPLPIRLKRRVHINITGSMNGFHSAGTQAATWKPVDGKVTEIFGVHDSEGVCMDPGAMSNALRSAIVRKATVLENKSTFPIALGVSISCLPNEERTDSGEPFCATVLPETTNTSPVVIYETDANSTESIEWRNKYPNYNSANLETWGVLDVQNCPFVFVHQNHPIVDLLRANKDILGADIDEQAKIDEQWFKVGRQILSTCCNMIKSKVLSRVATRDLNNFSVQLHPLNDMAWNEAGAGTEIVASMMANPQWNQQQHNAAEVAWANAQARKLCTYMARVELEYEIQP